MANKKGLWGNIFLLIILIIGLLLIFLIGVYFFSMIMISGFDSGDSLNKNVTAGANVNNSSNNRTANTDTRNTNNNNPPANNLPDTSGNVDTSGGEDPVYDPSGEDSEVVYPEEPTV